MSSARVLIIEDSASQSAVIADIVRQAGHVPVVYNQLKTGIRNILEKERPQLVLLDLRLVDSDGNKVTDGFVICREIKRSSQKPPVVVISAENREEAAEWAILQGADAYLQKPFVVEDLKAVIAQVLG